jgi:glycosyltransferase involved in cell wall biosynthesis
VTAYSPIVAFSHLRWDFVYQRPQQLLSRLAAQRRVLFVEEPVDGGPEPDGWQLSRPVRNVLVARPRLAGLGGKGPNEVHASTAALLRDLVRAEEIASPVAWVYTPMAEPLLDTVAPSLVVYDCMDELSLFLGAPPELAGMETALLSRADLVFTGGVSLYEAKRTRHPSVHCFPSSVDASHFARARPSARQETEPEDQAGLPRPRLGFFGVIDERLDLALVAALADARADWHVVMAGPVVKIDTATLPQRPNIHWLGQQPYGRLPALTAGWDVCLLPFALNEHTRFISPTKTLEYLAANKPVVGTPIKDVVDLYGPAVEVAGDHAAFIDACTRVLAESGEESAQRLRRAQAMVARYSWDATAARVIQLVDETLCRKEQHSAASA